jgi:GNAT superfamily N-acetyltransferase
MINGFEVDYARFNALKTVATATPSAFEHIRLGGLYVTRDQARPDSYYNRILGLTTASDPGLSDALSWIHDGIDPGVSVRIDIEADTEVADTEVADTVRQLGFQHVDTLIWLHADPIAPAEEADPAEPDLGRARLLTTADWPALRGLLERHGPIADAIWIDKRTHLCTDTFRWFGIFDGDWLVSAASSWITGSYAILGSAFTVPDWRGRGYQRQLLDTRRQLTPGRLFVDVAPESTSYRNCVQAGFVDLGFRQVWIREP